MRYLSANDLANLVPAPTLVTGIERGLRDLVEKKVIVSPRDHVDFDGNTLLTMPVVGAETFGVKAVSVHPSNANRGMPVINGLMALFDRDTGQPRSVMNAAALTAQRTGAVGAIGLKYTTPPDIERLGIVGVGVQGTWQAIFACAVRPIREIRFVCRSEQRARAFVEAVSKHAPDVRLIRCNDAVTVVSESQAIVAATTSQTPVLPNDRALIEGRHLLSVGSFKPTMQELPDVAFELAGSVVVDSDAARHEAGDLIRPIAAGSLRAENVIHIAELVAGQKKFDVSKTTVFKSVGQALYDLYSAQIFYTAAETANRGQHLDI